MGLSVSGYPIENPEFGCTGAEDLLRWGLCYQKKYSLATVNFRFLLQHMNDNCPML